MNRLDFLKCALLPLASPNILQTENFITPIVSSDNIQQVNTLSNNKAHYWNKDTRLTIAMWDFSWLTDQGKGGSFENIEQRVEEAAKRGYNTLRIDCFPSRLLQEETSFEIGYNYGRQLKLPAWGRVTTGFSCNALEKLIQLADACRKHNIWLGLDSWEKGHMLGLDPTEVIAEKKEEKALRGFAHTWVKAIRLMRDAGILERAVWIAPMNEVPHFATRNLESIRKISSHDLNEGNVKLDKNHLTNERLKLVNHWIGEEIKEETSKEGIPLSYSSLGSEEYSKRLTDIYDVVDVHFMPIAIYNKEDIQQFEAIAKDASKWPRFLEFEEIDLKRWSAVWDKACKNNYDAMLKRTKNYMNEALNNITLPNGKRMQAVITESFGPCYWPDHPDVSWEWYKHYNGDSARIAASMPFEGVSLSNYGEPLFTLWKDENWHHNANLFTLNVLE